jgi:hypothetical protein
VRGGIHNLAAKASVDLERPGTPQSEEIRRLVTASDFFSLPATLRKSRPQSWDFSYTVSVEDGARSHTVNCHKDAAPAELRKLIETLEPSARIEPPA